MILLNTKNWPKEVSKDQGEKAVIVQKVQWGSPPLSTKTGHGGQGVDLYSNLFV